MAIIEVNQTQSAIRKISVGSFRRRLTTTEKVAIESSTDPVVKVLDKDLMASSYVDLDFQQVIDGLAYLLSVGILANQARVDELLAGGTEDERP